MRRGRRRGEREEEREEITDVGRRGGRRLLAKDGEARTKGTMGQGQWVGGSG